MKKKLGWICSCISLVTYSCVVGEQITGFIKLERGLKQGHPLSTYLFILYAGCLSSLLLHAELSKCIQGLKVSRNSPSISHLCFTDDSMIFYKAKK